ncbi:MAG: transposase [Nitrospira sp.]|nr:transposase [Nitrospira sp.]
MARPLRIEFPGAIYHVTARGNARQAIVCDDEDRAVFLVCLGEVVLRFGWVCHAYCLMDNHYHLLIETPEGNVSRGMRQLNGVVTQRLNRRHRRVGHLFQGRFKAILVEREPYLVELCRYVVLNPIRAGLVRQLERYSWSSYPATRGLVDGPGWFSPDWVLGQFGPRRAVAQRRYAEFVADGMGRPSPWSAVRGQTLLGSESFVDSMRPLLDEKQTLKEIPRGQRLLHRPSLTQLFPKGVRADKRVRDLTIRTACVDYGYSMATIANHAGIHYSTVSKIVKGER